MKIMSKVNGEENLHSWIWCSRWTQETVRWHVDFIRLIQLVMGWNYRRWVVEELAKAMSKVDGIPPFPSSLSSELDPETRTMHLALAYQELKYTLAKIESDFSNFSAWHNRSKLLPRIWDGERLDSSARSKQRISGAWYPNSLMPQNLNFFNKPCLRTRVTKVFGFTIDGL